MRKERKVEATWREQSRIHSVGLKSFPSWGEVCLQEVEPRGRLETT